ncbi:cytochrome b/b6 domain-containing protein [Streptomyces sp. NBC_01497]|uniref:cytochrome b/b6 domain-containing protein n=1 Tax=Streptomyces sp. NBC_01497 TaxID=2903885 RepID=UPI002E305503|nr:cytochrome b/b6 domain-containing protein [Streptomyces sp. NBC_01497]
MTSTDGSDARTGGTTSRRSEAAAGPDGVRRFTLAERLVHRTTSWLMLLCVGTAAFLYVPQLAELVGRRYLVVTVHEWSGILIPVPFLAGLVSRALRRDLERINRFAPYDREWLRAVRRRWNWAGARPAGKFNAGQKIYASWIAGATILMIFTGLLMWFTGLFPLVSRTSATFIHDWLALAIGIVLFGHIGMAFKDPGARHGMRTGSVDRAWARREHSEWEDEMAAEEGAAGAAGGAARPAPVTDLPEGRG